MLKLYSLNSRRTVLDDQQFMEGDVGSSLSSEIKDFPGVSPHYQLLH